MNILRDGKDQPFVEWEQGPNGAKRAWIRHADPETDWAETGRYLNVVRIEGLGNGPAGQSTDFPIFNDLPDEQVLVTFVAPAIRKAQGIVTRQGGDERSEGSLERSEIEPGRPEGDAPKGDEG